MSPLEQVTVMITLIRQLEGVMDREVNALKSLAIAEVEALQDEKNLLAEAYGIEMGRLRKAPEVLGSLEEHVRLTLEDAVRALQATATRNADALFAAQSVIERIVEKLAESARGVRQGLTGYGPGSGAAGDVRPQAAAQGTGGQVIAVAFNHAV